MPPSFLKRKGPRREFVMPVACGGGLLPVRVVDNPTLAEVRRALLDPTNEAGYLVDDRRLVYGTPECVPLPRETKAHLWFIHNHPGCPPTPWPSNADWGALNYFGARRSDIVTPECFGITPEGLSVRVGVVGLYDNLRVREGRWPFDPLAPKQGFPPAPDARYRAGIVKHEDYDFFNDKTMGAKWLKEYAEHPPEMEDVPVERYKLLEVDGPRLRKRRRQRRRSSRLR